MSHKFSVFFLQNCKKQEIVFYVIAFDPSKIQACQAHQNDRRKPNFVKDINVVGKKMSLKGHKMANSQIIPVFYASDYRQSFDSYMYIGGFHLHILVFPFIYKFNSRIGVLVYSSFATDQFRRISTTFQHHFKICLLQFFHEKECSFYTHLFYCTEMTWLFISSTAI